MNKPWNRKRDDWNDAIREGRVVRAGDTAQSFPTAIEARLELRRLQRGGNVEAEIIGVGRVGITI